jgi:anhydro-N-acetylmuramic acid kinase
MKNQIESLYKLSLKEERKILSLMSGTSLDGLDVALVCCKGAHPLLEYNLEKFITFEYDDDFRNEILKVFSVKIGDIQQLTILHSYIAEIHIQYIRKALKIWEMKANEIDIICSHGQTMFHAPFSLHNLQGMPNATLQLGDGDRIAARTGIITVSDLRQKDIAYGDEGAPLAKYGDYLMYSSKLKNRILINLGGIANFSWLPKACELKDIVSSDTGPANGMMNAYMRYQFNTSYDNGGELASKGNVNKSLLKELLSHPFLSLPFPKTTGPETFNLNTLFETQHFKHCSPEDVMATLSLYSARSVCDAINSLDVDVDEALVSGGGILNKTLINNIERCLKPNIELKLLMEGQAKESIFFALFANELIAGNHKRINFGKISLP